MLPSQAVAQDAEPSPRPAAGAQADVEQPGGDGVSEGSPGPQADPREPSGDPDPPAEPDPEPPQEQEPSQPPDAGASCPAPPGAEPQGEQRPPFETAANPPAFRWVGPTKTRPRLNRALASVQVNVRFKLAGRTSLDILADPSPVSQRIDWRTRRPSGSRTPAQPPGADGLTYSSGSIRLRKHPSAAVSVRSRNLVGSTSTNVADLIAANNPTATTVTVDGAGFTGGATPCATP